MMKIVMLANVILMLVLLIFFFSSKKMKWYKCNSSSFECGFTSYYKSRNSFSVHYLIIALIFLFFDLELCFLMPFMNEWSSSEILIKSLYIFIFLLLSGLIIELISKKLQWLD